MQIIILILVILGASELNFHTGNGVEGAKNNNSDNVTNDNK